MENDLTAGMSYEFSFVVSMADTAEALGSGDLLVLATPLLIAGLEKAARLAVSPHLPDGYTTVGTQLNVEHCAATPVGMKVTMHAVLAEINGRRLTFDVDAYDEMERIGGGRHDRFIIQTERFMKKTNSKIQEA